MRVMQIRKIKRIQPVGVMETLDIDARPHQNYLLSNNILTHNSQITMDNMKNIMKASARFEQINWSIVGIELLPMHVYNYVLRAEAKDYDETNIRKSKAFIAELWMKVWEDLYGNYMQIGKVNVPIVLSEQWIDEYHLKQKAPKVASVLRDEGLVERQGMQNVWDRVYGRRTRQ
mgnify:FL=1